MRESKTTTIGAYEYTVYQLGAIDGRRILTKLAKVAGPAFAGLKPGQANDFFGKLLDALDVELVDALCDKFAEFTEVQLDAEHKPFLKGKFDDHFAGKYGEMLSWLVFCLEVNFSNFFQELGLKVPSKAEIAAKAKDQESDSPKTSTGGSGA